MVRRKIYQMKLDLNELFAVIKFVVKMENEPVRSLIMQDIEAKILDNIIDIEQHEYQSLFKLLNFMRMHDISPKINPEQLQKVSKNNPQTE